jgi:hypothetical protein
MFVLLLNAKLHNQLFCLQFFVYAGFVKMVYVNAIAVAARQYIHQISKAPRFYAHF